MSGLIYAVIVAVWLAVLIPIWLRRHDDAAVTRSADRYSRAMRTLSRRPGPAGSREIVMPPRPQVAMAATGGGTGSSPVTVTATVTPSAAGPRAVPRHEVPGGAGVPAGSGGSRRPAGSRPDRRTRAASARLARRRARTLLLLLALTFVVLALGLAGVVPLWAVALPAVLVVAFVVHLRLQARRAAQRRRSPVAEPGTRPANASVTRRARPRSTEASEAATTSRAMVVESKDEGTLGGTTAAPQAVTPEPGGPAAHVPDDAAALDDEEAWRPQSWPLPTYVTKPKAVRPVRVIDLTTPGAWTSGRVLDDEAEPVEEVLAAAEETTLELDAIVDRAVND